MKKYARFIVLMLGMVLLMGIVAAPALACDDENNLTPGYWKNHAEAWPCDTLVIGGVVYDKSDVIAMLDQVPGDKSLTMFRAVAAAKLNRLAFGGDMWFIDAGDWWLYMNPPGSGVKGSSEAWQSSGEQLYKWLDAWNNAMYDELYPF